MFDKKEDKVSAERKQAIFLKVRSILAQQLKVNEDKITLASFVTEDLGADSLDATEIIMDLETEFNLEILDTEAEKIKTVEDIVTYLAGRFKQ